MLKSLKLIPALSVLLASCSAPTSGGEDEVWRWKLPSTFDSVPGQPDDNLITLLRLELGKKFFHDSRLSGDGKIACASCHKATLAFADTAALSAGVHGRRDGRNSPSLVNVGYQKALFMEGGVPSLELQVLAPFGNENEMDFTLTDAATVLRKDQDLADLAAKAYGKTIDGYVISRALAAYQRSLVSKPNGWDRYQDGDTAALSASARRGMAVFFNPENACSTCHAGFLFTDQNYHNIGLYTYYDDEGRSRLTLQDQDIGKFKTPGLRNVELTPPYMHNGSMKTLEDVIAFKSDGGADHPNKSVLSKKLNLSEGEKLDLKNFLLALTDQASY